MDNSLGENKNREHAVYFFENAERFAYEIFVSTNYGGRKLDGKRLRRLASASVAGRASIDLTIDEMVFAHAIHQAIDLAIRALNEGATVEDFESNCLDITTRAIRTSEPGSCNLIENYPLEITGILASHYRSASLGRYYCK